MSRRQPATFGDFLVAAGYAVVAVQVAVLGFLGLAVLAVIFVSGRSGGTFAPSWLLWADLLASALAVIVMFVRYQLGDLDRYEVRRRRGLTRR
jgi:hypothetical protein